MKKITFILFLLSAIFFSAEAQKLSKKERKQIKKELKQLRKNPEKYVRQKEENEEAINLLNETISENAADLTEKNNLIGELKDTISNLRIKNVELQNEITKQSDPKYNHPQLGYRVQIGYYKVFDLNKYLLENPKDIYSESVEGANRYSIGYFDDLEVAKSFRNDIRKMGIKGAFVTEYKEGVRNMEFEVK